MKFREQHLRDGQQPTQTRYRASQQQPRVATPPANPRFSEPSSRQNELSTPSCCLPQQPPQNPSTHTHSRTHPPHTQFSLSGTTRVTAMGPQKLAALTRSKRRACSAPSSSPRVFGGASFSAQHSVSLSTALSLSLTTPDSTHFAVGLCDLREDAHNRPD